MKRTLKVMLLKLQRVLHRERYRVLTQQTNKQTNKQTSCRCNVGIPHPGKNSNSKTVQAYQLYSFTYVITWWYL